MTRGVEEDHGEVTSKNAPTIMALIDLWVTTQSGGDVAKSAESVAAHAKNHVGYLWDRD